MNQEKRTGSSRWLRQVMLKWPLLGLLIGAIILSELLLEGGGLAGVWPNQVLAALAFQTLQPLPDKFLFAIGAQAPLGQFNEPHDVAVAPDGTVYVADPSNRRIQHFNATGAFLESWGHLGRGDGEFDWAAGVAVAPDGTVYVVDSGNHCIQHFSATGQFLGKWGSYGSSDGRFQFPFGVAVAADSTVYVAEGGNHRIQRFSATGQFLGKWGTYGTSDGQFDEPYGIAVAPNGTVYVADRYNHRIQRFSATGQFLGKWGSYGSSDGQFKEPLGVAVAPNGTVYVADRYNHLVQRFSATGQFMSKWGSYGSGNKQFNEPLGVAVAPDGTVYVADRYNHRVQQFSATGQFLRKWGSQGVSDGQFNHLLDIDVAPDNSIYVVDNWDNRVQHLSAMGIFLDKWGSTGSSNGAFNGPEGIGVAPDGTVYVADAGNHRIQRFSATGQFLGKWGSYGTGNGQFNRPRDVAVAPNGTVYVVDTRNHRIQRFSATGQYLGKWGSQGSGDGQFNEPQGVAVASDGTVYVTETGNNRIQRFTATGQFVSKWGSQGSGDGQFQGPWGITVASDGTIYVTDWLNFRVQRFSSTGTFLGKWGWWDIREGAFAWPTGIAIATDGTAYVSEWDNRRIQAFGPQYSTTWRGEYFANRWLAEAPVLIRDEAEINFNWGTGSPGSGVPADNFSARWQRYVWFEADTYRFTVFADDGVRLWVDERLLIDQWQDQIATYSADLSLTQGYHRVRLEYYEHSGSAAVRLSTAYTNGYTYKDSSEPGGPTYQWVDISGTGTAVYLGDDNFGGPFDIGFTFNFHNTDWTQFYVSSNGFLSFGSGSGDLSNDCPLPNANTPNNIIALMWDDLDPGDTGDRAYYRTFPSCPYGGGACLVVQYENYHHFPGGGTIAGTFEAILFQNGSILIQFEDAGAEEGSGSTTGIENSTGTIGLTYACDTAASLSDDLAICFAYPGQPSDCSLLLPTIQVSDYAVDDDIFGDSYGNNDGIANPGEFLEIALSLINTGDTIATNVVVTPTTTSPYVNPYGVYFYDDWLEFGDIAPGEVVIGDDFDFALSSETPDGTVITFDLEISDGIHTWFDSFDLSVSGSDTTPPAIDYADVQPRYVPVGTTGTIFAFIREGGDLSSVTAYIESPDETVIGTITLYDDGAHNDWTAGDRWFAGSWTPFSELDYYVDFEAADAYGNVGTANNIAFFSSKPFVKTTDILFVPDYGGNSTDWFHPYFTVALDYLGYSYDIWDTWLRGAPDGATLNLYTDGVVIWASPDYGYFSYSDVRSDIEAYLDAGGGLFISGQDIGQDLNGTTLLSDYLHATWVQDNTDMGALNGVAGDPIGDGLRLGIYGYETDEIDPISPAMVVFTYDTGFVTAEMEAPQPETQRQTNDLEPQERWAEDQQEPETIPHARLAGIISSGTAALRVDTGTYKVVFFAFGLENIQSGVDRIAVVERVLTWLGAAGPPDIHVTPPSLEVMLAEGATTAQTVAISNVGERALAFNMYEKLYRVLIIQDRYPWGYDSIQMLLFTQGIAYDQVDSSQISTVNLSPYDLVVIPSVQPDSLYTSWNANITRFEAYVRDSGDLWLSTCTYSSTSPEPLIPGGVITANDFDYYNIVVQPDHPWVVGVPNTIYGTLASHNSFSSLYPGSVVIAQAQTSGNATLVEYRLGGGRILITGQTLEFAWRWGWDGALILENSLLDMMEHAGQDITWLSEAPIIGRVDAGGSQDVSVTLDATGLAPGTYTANMIIANNDPDENPVTVPVTLHVATPTPTPTTTATATATPTPTVTPTPRSRFVYLPLIMKMPPPPLRNGDFETGAFSPYWPQGGELASSVVEWLDVGEPNPTFEPPYAGHYSALLGNPDWGVGWPNPIPAGSAWIQQQILVPNTGNPRLTFWYRIMSYDVMQGVRLWDTFDVTINDTTNVVWRDGPDRPMGFQGTRYDSDWKSGVVDLGPWRGQEIVIRFAVWNRDYEGDGVDYYNTWTYLDEVHVAP